jgi:hypothetical protein
VLNQLRLFGGALRAGWDGLFAPPPRIDDAKTLADFIDAQSAFLVQKGIYEYSRARAGHYSKVLFKEQVFIDALDRSRWSAYPLGLAMVGELVEGVLRPHAGDDPDGQRDALRQLVLSVFDRYPAPTALAAPSWSQARRELSRRLQLVGLHPTKRAFEIADPYLKAYFDLLPINESLRRSELPTIHGYLRATLCNVHEELTRRMQAPALVASVRARHGGGEEVANSPRA